MYLLCLEQIFDEVRMRVPANVELPCRLHYESYASLYPIVPTDVNLL